MLAELFIWKMHGYLQVVFFLDSSSPCEDLLFPHSHKPCKNASVLEGTITTTLQVYREFTFFCHWVLKHLEFHQIYNSWIAEKTGLDCIKIKFYYDQLTSKFQKFNIMNQCTRNACWKCAGESTFGLWTSYNCLISPHKSCYTRAGYFSHHNNSGI